MNRKQDSIPVQRQADAYTINQAADLLGADTSEVIDAAGLTLGELELGAVEIGLSVTDYRNVPVLRQRDLEVIASRLDAQPYL
ncbi:hypothetical protein JWS13_10000 [Rhodococcus pseudokoreensis]|uniref:Translation initiation factor IF-2 N-terminal domain-containing protein n=1 Tax=Rhodococcus pseudokoreensis TaxID=2811421 RepID=A0A974ZSS6_9NOCA|nr:hypothetical protein [Rhodococcus pseudokoreensis]QSE88914.1 hypothetical protein JWS13_10000 [Rhodococcus pseudokoreensis]